MCGVLAGSCASSPCLCDRFSGQAGPLPSRRVTHLSRTALNLKGGGDPGLLEDQDPKFQLWPPGVAHAPCRSALGSAVPGAQMRPAGCHPGHRSSVIALGFSRVWPRAVPCPPALGALGRRGTQGTGTLASIHPAALPPPSPPAPPPLTLATPEKPTRPGPLFDVTPTGANSASRGASPAPFVRTELGVLPAQGSPVSPRLAWPTAPELSSGSFPRPGQAVVSHFLLREARAALRFCESP
jgi:hypothetical protein